MLLVAKPKLDILTLTDAFAVCLIQPLNGYVSGLAQKWFHKHPRKEMVKIKAHNTAICVDAVGSFPKLSVCRSASLDRYTPSHTL